MSQGTTHPPIDPENCKDCAARQADIDAELARREGEGLCVECGRFYAHTHQVSGHRHGYRKDQTK